MGRDPRPRAGPAHPQHVRRRARRHLQGPLRPGRGHRPVRPQHPARRPPRLRRHGLRRRAGPLPQRDRQVRPRLPARHVVPGEGRHLHQRRAPDQPRAPGVRRQVRRDEWEVTCAIGRAHGLRDGLRPTPPRLWTRLPRPPRRSPASVARLDELGSIQWPCNDTAPTGTPTMHVDDFVRGKGLFIETVFVPTDRAGDRKFPLLLTTGRILASTTSAPRPAGPPTTPGIPRTSSTSTPATPRSAASTTATVALASRVGETALRAQLSERMQPAWSTRRSTTR